jgi:hypothetical protein
MSRLRKYGWLILIPLLPIVLNYLLPLANWSKIGGSNSLVVWLEFWASYGNALIVSVVTLFVLKRQIETNTEENNKNRKSANCQFLYIQKKQDYKELITILIKYVQLYNLSYIEQCAKEDLINPQTCSIKFKELKKEAHYVWLQLSLFNNMDNEASSFIDSQKRNYNKLNELIDLFIFLNGIGLYNFCSKDKDVIKQAIAKYPKLENCAGEKNPIESIIKDYNSIQEADIEYQINQYLLSVEAKLNDILK